MVESGSFVEIMQNCHYSFYGNFIVFLIEETVFSQQLPSRAIFLNLKNTMKADFTSHNKR